MLRIVETCPFCAAEPGRILLESEHALSDTYPVVDGTTVIVPRKHVSTIYELTGLKPSGFSTRLSDTMENGDLLGHACVHVVPRHRGDNLELPDGIEWVTDDHQAFNSKI